MSILCADFSQVVVCLTPCIEFEWQCMLDVYTWCSWFFTWKVLAGTKNCYSIKCIAGLVVDKSCLLLHIWYCTIEYRMIAWRGAVLLEKEQVCSSRNPPPKDVKWTATVILSSSTKIVGHCKSTHMATSQRTELNKKGHARAIKRSCTWSIYTSHRML